MPDNNIYEVMRRRQQAKALEEAYASVNKRAERQQKQNLN